MLHRDGNHHDTYQVNEKERRQRERERAGVRSRAREDDRERESVRDGNRCKRLCEEQDLSECILTQRERLIKLRK